MVDRAAGCNVHAAGTRADRRNCLPLMRNEQPDGPTVGKRANLYERRRLRLGALLYQLRYYADPKMIDAQGRIALYRYDQTRYIEVSGATVRLIREGTVEILELEEAIVRCKAALTGRPLHGTAD